MLKLAFRYDETQMVALKTKTKWVPNQARAKSLFHFNLIVVS